MNYLIKATNRVFHNISEQEYRQLPYPSYSSLKGKTVTPTRKMLIGTAVDKYIFEGKDFCLDFCKRNNLEMDVIKLIFNAAETVKMNYNFLLQESTFQLKVTADLALIVYTPHTPLKEGKETPHAPLKEGKEINKKPLKSMIDIFNPSINAVIDLKCVFTDDFQKSIAYFDYPQQINTYAIMTDATAGYLIIINPFTKKHQLVQIPIDQSKHCETLLNYLTNVL